MSKKHDAKYKYVECYLNDMQEIDNRLKNRKRMISQIQHVESEGLFKNWVGNSKKPSDSHYLIVDSGQPLDCYINEVMIYINS